MSYKINPDQIDDRYFEGVTGGQTAVAIAHALFCQTHLSQQVFRRMANIGEPQQALHVAIALVGVMAELQLAEEWDNQNRDDMDDARTIATELAELIIDGQHLEMYPAVAVELWNKIAEKL